MLAATRVLKFVDEQMSDFVGERPRGLGGKSVGVAENGLSDLRNLNEPSGCLIRRPFFTASLFEPQCLVT